jgi:NAD(P)-dependent dehydrogenase (short-subunit alcohol dehydrogenase family)
LNTNLKGAFFLCKHALHDMLARRYGKIVNVSSIAGRNRSIVASAAYTSSKYGLIGLTRQLAFHYASSNININCVCPSQTETPMLARAPKEKIEALVATIPARRLGTPGEVAECVLFLCSDAVGYVNGAVLDVNGAQL